MFIVVMQPWIESERGWGQRPDGYSLHLNLIDHAAFVKDYWDSMPNDVPDEYSRPDEVPRWIKIDNDTFSKLTETKNGLRVYGAAWVDLP